MNKAIVFDISCEVCRDLIPLVVDGVASADSEALVQEHVSHCEKCRTYMETGKPPDQEASLPEPDVTRIILRIQRKMLLQTSFFVILGTVFALMVNQSIYLIWAFPCIGFFSYFSLRKNSWLVPVLMCIPMLLIFFSSSGFYYSIYLSVIYGFGIGVGCIIGALFHFAFGGLLTKRRKNKGDCYETENKV